MVAELLAVLAALFFGLNLATSRKGLLRTYAYAGVFLSLVIGCPMYLLISLLIGEFGTFSFDLYGFAAVSLAGLLHFGLGRYLLYRSIQLVGANVSGPITASSALYSAILGLTLLKESLSVLDMIGVSLVIIGVAVVSLRGLTVFKSVKGVSYALITSIIFSITPLLVKVGTVSLKAPILSTFISYSITLVLYTSLMIFKTRLRHELRNINLNALVPLITAALAVNIAQLIRYYALSIGNVSVVTPIISTNSLFGMMFSYLINREVEDFSLKLVFGALVMIIGIFLIMTA